MNEIIISETDIKNKIYEIRGVQVMLDSDLAELYQVETKRINEAVRRNSEKFPGRFCWELSDEDSKFFWSHFATKKKKLAVEDIKILKSLQNRVSLCLQLF